MTSTAELKYQTESVKNASDIVAVIGEYVPLRKAGLQFVGLCPFHREKTPSFTVHPTKGLFKCFGCGEGGDVFRFTQLIEGVDFKGARALLADRAGIQLSHRRLTREEKRQFAQRRDAGEWRDALMRALRIERNRLLCTLARARRFILAGDFDVCERLRPGHFGLVMDLAETYSARIDGLDESIALLGNADFDQLVRLFRVRGAAARKVLREHRADLDNARAICEAIVAPIAIAQLREKDFTNEEATHHEARREAR
jgi:hypothetical protein